MDQMISILRAIEEQKNPIFSADDNNIKILELYKTIYEIANDKNSYVEQSTAMLNALSENNLSEEEKQQWLAYAAGIFASYLAVKLYEERGIVKGHFSCEDLNQVLDFFLNGNFGPEVTSVGVYACAQQYITEEPMRCYELTKAAFTIHPDLAGILGVAYRYEGAAAEKLWMKCERCGNYFTYNFPKDKVGAINGHYTSGKSDIILENKFILATYNQIFQQFRRMTPGKEYLEIGVGTGEMLAVALEFGYHAEAVEICREDSERISLALGVDIKWCDITDYETEKQYDVIVMGDVLEHVIHPVEVLKKVKKMLADGGVLWISTPNYNCACARMQNFAHCMWHELNHYTYVSYETLKDLLKTIELEIVHYEMSIRYNGSMELFVRHAK